MSKTEPWPRGQHDDQGWAESCLKDDAGNTGCRLHQLCLGEGTSENEQSKAELGIVDDTCKRERKAALE